MKVSIEWLQEFVDFKLSPQELSHLLTMAGLEVEASETVDGDTILDVSITPNRADCLSVLGIAREISANLGVPIRQPLISVKEDETTSPDIEIIDTEICHRYASRIIYGVRVGQSPEWLVRRLEAHGMRAVNNVVDVTNYVMLEMGHPLHAFDLNRLEGRRIVVKRAGDVGRFKTLDGEERRLNRDMLMIWDAVRPVAIAGVMGGLDSEVTPSTTDVLLESAYFDPVSVRRTSKALGLTTEASYRFERGTDIEMIVRALDRATALIKELAGGRVTALTDNYPIPYTPPEVSVSLQRIRGLLGIEIDESSIVEILKRLNLQYKKEGEGFVITPPSFRRDIQQDVDVIEEVARLYGYEKIPSTMPAIRLKRIEGNDNFRTIRLIKDAMVKAGFSEVINTSFLNPSALDELNIPDNDRRRRLVHIKNPLRREESCLRTTLVPSLLNNAVLNQNRGERAFSLFELSRVFFDRAEALPDEVMQMAAIHCRPLRPSIWEKAHNGFYDIKGAIEGLFDFLKIKGYSFQRSDKPPQPYLNPVRSCAIVINGEVVGSVGELHPSVVSLYELRGDISIFEINDLEALIRAIPSRITYRQLPRFPYVERDISILVNKDVPVAEIEGVISSLNSEIIESVRLFDIYTGKQIPPEKKSIAFTIRYRSSDRTLTDDEVDELHSKIIDTLRHTINAELRG
jgi:phenylalanyl-tRNA synthetase beta chain